MTTADEQVRAEKLNAPPVLPAVQAPARRAEVSCGLVLAAIAALWLYGWVGNFVLTLQLGRYDSQAIDAAVRSTPLVSVIFQVTMYAAILALVAAIVVSINVAHTVPLHGLIALLAPWIVLYPLFSFARGMVVSREDVLFPLFITAIYIARPKIAQVGKLIAILCTVSAGASVAIGIVYSSVALMPPSWDEGKSFIGNSSLAGIFGHSNHLGTILALSLPFIIWFYKGASRNLCLLVIFIALIWSASRASIAAAVAFCIVALLLSQSGSLRRRNRDSIILLAAILVGVVAAVWLPLNTADPSAFSNRGRIWQASLEFWSLSPWLGWGPDVLSSKSDLTMYIGAIPRHSHDVWLTFATTGGLLALAALLIASITVISRATRVYRNGETLPLLFILMLVLLSIAEDPIRVMQAGPQAFIVWPGLVLAFCIPRCLPSDTDNSPMAQELAERNAVRRPR